MGLGKRQLVLAALILALGAAVYLNWQFSDSKNLIATNTLEAAKELGEAKFVNNSVTEEPQEQEQIEEENPQETNSQESDEYFSKAKENRQTARDQATDMAKEILNDIKSSDEAKAEAVKQAADIAKNMQQESNIESLIKAKGFSECLAFIQNGECSIVVSKDGLNENSAIMIKDVISGQSGVTYDKIKITECQ